MKKSKSEEHKKNDSIAHKKLYENGYINPMTGKHHSEETKKLISEKAKNREIVMYK